MIKGVDEKELRMMSGPYQPPHHPELRRKVPTGPLSQPARSVWAKAPWDRLTGAPLAETLSLAQHLGDTMAVAGYLWDEFLPLHVHEQIARVFGGDEAARAALTFLAGAHDIGKASPAFAVMAPHLAQRMAEHGLGTHIAKDADGRSQARHEIVGHLAMRDWLTAQHGFGRATANALAMVVGGHHGAPPEPAQIAFVAEHPELLGEGLWIKVREEFLAWSATESDAVRFLDTWSALSIPQSVQAVLCGTVIIADWVASNERYFPYDEHEDRGIRARRAWNALNLPHPWRAAEPPADADTQLRSRFDLPQGAFARPLQRAAADAARAVEHPCLMIIEAAMGDGKTEASWLAAEILAHRFKLGGVYDALPTQATSNAIFRRMRDWIGHLDSERGDELVSVFLAHNKRDLDDDYQQLRYTGRHSGIGDDEPAVERGDVEAVVHSWLADRKRGMLSSFVTGTIDQVLMMALKSRHVALRHLALAGKVVILDEIHSYSEFMNVYLDRALTWLAAYDVPVIILSATLPPSRRRELIAAYESGSPRGPGEAPFTDPPTSAYPLITVTDGGEKRLSLRPEASGRDSRIRLRPLTDTDAVTADLLTEKLAAGGCAVVIRNTVRRAQATAAVLRERFGVESVTLAHSRFLAFDRARSDRELLRLFGNGSDADRPPLHIVVATQVVEQSLDVDFDLMVSDLAPMDLLLQRAGRLHRHPRTNRPGPVGEPLMYISGARWHENPPAPNEGFLPVYGADSLLRAAAVLRLDTRSEQVVELPSDIPELVARAYSDELEAPAGWADAWRQAQDDAMSLSAKKKSDAEVFRLAAPDPRGRYLAGWISGGHRDADPESAKGHTARAAVRDGAGGIEVVVLLEDEVPGMAVVPPGHPTHAGAQLSLTLPPDDWRLRRAALTSTIQISEYQLGGAAATDAFITRLEERTDTAGWDATPELRGQLVLLLDAAGEAVVGGHRFTYSQADGMRIERA
jgi:CRISPR-associated endonuclease/helicase Cas3